MDSSRRKFLKNGSLGGVGLLTFHIAGCDREMTPAAARDEQLPLQVLSPTEQQLLEIVGNVVLPGSVEAGLVHYIDHQLAAAPSDCMLMIRYLGVPAPFLPFYRSGLTALEAAAAAMFDAPAGDLQPPQRAKLVRQMATGSIESWEGPPAGFFFFVLRSDAVDVRYGTPEGFKDLGIPYMAHIEPPTPWGA